MSTTIRPAMFFCCRLQEIHQEQMVMVDENLAHRCGVCMEKVDHSKPHICSKQGSVKDHVDMRAMISSLIEQRNNVYSATAQVLVQTLKSVQDLFVHDLSRKKLEDEITIEQNKIQEQMLALDDMEADINIAWVEYLRVSF